MLSKTSTQLSDPTSLLFNGHRGPFVGDKSIGTSVRLLTCLTSRWIKNGTNLPILHMPSWHVQYRDNRTFSLSHPSKTVIGCYWAPVRTKCCDSKQRDTARHFEILQNKAMGSKLACLSHCAITMLQPNYMAVQRRTHPLSP
jgi:hypothetical protein